MWWVRQGLFLALILMCLLGAGNVLVFVDAERTQISALTPFGSEAAAPEVVLLTNLLGGFRCLLVDLVWYRAVQLQQDNQFWELYQLYDWMGKLEPHLESIWVFNGWNMSYNLIAELDDSEGRWRWIERAISYLRDEGLKYNPQSGPILKEISWIYYHKIGKGLDLHNLYYKHRLALEMNAIFGDADMQDMKGYAEAPRELEELLADSDVRLALKDFYLSPDDPVVGKLDEAVGIYAIPPAIMKVLLAKKGELTSMGEFLASKDGKAARKIINYVVAKTLREQLKMGDRVIHGRVVNGLEICYGLELEFGKFDWRLSEPHSLFWGTMAAMSDPNITKQIDYDRMIVFSIQQAMRRGLISILPPQPTGDIMTCVDLTKIKPLNALYGRMIAKHPNDWDHRGGQSIMDGHMSFLQEAARMLYMAGYEDDAAAYHEQLRVMYDKPQPWVPVKEYVVGQIKKGIDENWTYDKAKAWLDSLTRRSLILYCQNNFAQARIWQQLGKRGWAAYSDYYTAQAEGHGVEKGKEHNAPEGRIRHAGNLPSWDEVYKENVRLILTGERPFPAFYRKILAVRLGWNQEQEKFEEWLNTWVRTWTPPKGGIVPGVAPSTPAPK